MEAKMILQPPKISSQGLVVFVCCLAAALLILGWSLKAKQPVSSVSIAPGKQRNETVRTAVSGIASGTATKTRSFPVASLVANNLPEVWYEDDKIAVNALKIGEDQGRHLQEELDSNAGLPEQERSTLLPKAETIRAVESGKVLLQ